MTLSRRQALKGATRHRGFAVTVLVLVLGVGASALLVSHFNVTRLARESAQKTTDALATAKAALIGYALRGRDGATNPQRPGEFPCPDTNNDGFGDGTCISGRLGRIPWKTLRIPEPKDSAGETLWYAIAGPFRSFNSGALNSSPINSDTRGNITVYAADGAAQLTGQAVAVIFAPGPALGAQSRAGTTALCATTNTTVARNLCAANYLEASAGTNNATTNGPFISGLRSADYNDRVAYVTTPEFMPIVEQRVARELKATLQAYYDANGYFPFAAKYDDPTGNCAMNVRRGRLPLFIRVEPTTNPPNPVCGTPPSMTFPAGTGLAEWTASLPSWFMVNQWYKVVYYSVASGYVSEGPNSCAGGGCLTVGSNTVVPALFFTPGTPRGAAMRPSNNLADYLEDTQNQNGWGAGANDIYATPGATAFDRDRVYTLAGGVSQCANNANALLELAPCGQPPRLNSQCVTRAASLAACASNCSAAANQLINTPCQNTLKPPACQSAIAALRVCRSSGGNDDDDKDKDG